MGPHIFHPGHWWPMLGRTIVYPSSFFANRLGRLSLARQVLFESHSVYGFVQVILLLNQTLPSTM